MTMMKIGLSSHNLAGAFGVKYPDDHAAVPFTSGTGVKPPDSGTFSSDGEIGSAPFTLRAVCGASSSVLPLRWGFSVVLGGVGASPLMCRAEKEEVRLKLRVGEGISTSTVSPRAEFSLIGGGESLGCEDDEDEGTGVSGAGVVCAGVGAGADTGSGPL